MQAPGNLARVVSPSGGSPLARDPDVKVASKLARTFSPGCGKLRGIGLIANEIWLQLNCAGLVAQRIHQRRACRTSRQLLVCSDSWLSRLVCSANHSRMVGEISCSRGDPSSRGGSVRG